MEDIYVSFKFHHGGKFVNDPNPRVEDNVNVNTATSIRVKDNISVNPASGVNEEYNIGGNATTGGNEEVNIAKNKSNSVGEKANSGANIEVENDDNVLDEVDISEKEEEDSLVGDSNSKDSICEGLDANPVEGSDEDEELRAVRENV
ncbi:hypothetical protein GH714_036543 [Hevea brasiliensis]|uniref:Uncharacterized protein n=1 Tax=Hevea brasiliensis TaxID=3981 RepID=A0A6A6LPQ8_HEVBR|nr:hypothetical protein GH714_036543 [Hevea brasiliensis]